MLDEKQIERYRNMTQADRWREVEALMDFAWSMLKDLPPEEVQRRLDADYKAHDEADHRIMEFLGRFP